MLLEIPKWGEKIFDRSFDEMTIILAPLMKGLRGHHHPNSDATAESSNFKILYF